MPLSSRLATELFLIVRLFGTCETSGRGVNTDEVYAIADELGVRLPDGSAEKGTVDATDDGNGRRRPEP